MKKWFPLVMLVLVFIQLVSTSFAENKSAEKNMQMNGAFGATSINGVIWYNLSLFPELVFGKLGIGLYIQILYNDEEGIRDEDWNNWQDWAQIVYYVRWAHKGEPLYIRAGALTDTTLGHGIIVGHYTNQLDINNRKIGLVFDVNMNEETYGFETMTNDVLKARVMGIRGYFRPLPNTSILRKFVIGATYATDIDPDENRDTKNDGVAVFGGDIGFPLFKNIAFSSLLYDDWAKIRPENTTIRKQFEEDKSDWGNAIGLMGNIAVVDYRVEKRNFKKNFVGPYFDSFYEIERADKLNSLSANTEDLKGWYGELSYTNMGLYVMMAYEDYESRYPRMRGEASLKGAVPNISFKMIYDKKEIENFPEDLGELDRSSLLTTEVGYNIAPHFETVIIYRQAFDKNGNVTKTSSLQTRFSF